MGDHFLSKKLVVCRSKMSLTYGPLTVIILGPSGHPKSIKYEIVFGADLVDFENDGGQQSIEINALLSEGLMLFQQFCCSGVGRYQPVQAHLRIRATTFYALPVPLPRQVYF